MRTRLGRLLTTLAACAIVLAGCGTTAQPPVPENTDPSAPAQSEAPNLFAEITAADYTSWAPAPGYETRKSAKGPHGDEVQILLDPVAAQGLAAGGGTWPVGAVIVKDIYTGGTLTQTAAMKKTRDGWYWGEWGEQGPVVAEGVGVEPCESCHAKGTDGTLGVTLK